MKMTSRTLLLNGDFSPLRTITLKRAIVLVLQEKAEVVELEKTGVIRSATQEFGLPSVIRLKYFVKVPYRARLPLNRRAVLTRDDHTCQFAGCDRRGTTIDHIRPRSRGGKHEWTNVVAACQKCNAKKSDKTLEELGWSLKRKPYTPKGTMWMVIGTVPKEDWEPYIASWSAAVT